MTEPYLGRPSPIWADRALLLPNPPQKTGDAEGSVFTQVSFSSFFFFFFNIGFPAKLGMLASCQLAAVPNANADPFFFVGSAKVPKEGSDGIGIGIGIGTWHKVGTAWHGWHEVGIGPDATWQQEA